MEEQLQNLAVSNYHGEVGELSSLPNVLIESSRVGHSGSSEKHVPCTESPIIRREECDSGKTSQNERTPPAEQSLDIDSLEDETTGHTEAKVQSEVKVEASFDSEPVSEAYDTPAEIDLETDNTCVSSKSEMVCIRTQGGTLGTLSPLPSGDLSLSKSSTLSFGVSETHGDLSSAKKQLDETSLAFIERLHDAAQRRKLHVTRDLLGKKEKTMLQSIASPEKRYSSSSSKKSETEKRKSKPIQSAASPGSNTTSHTFKALPLPETTGVKGSGGDYGVPKVSKRPATVPLSPLLGHRRPEKVLVKALEAHPEAPKRRSNVPKQVKDRLKDSYNEARAPKGGPEHDSTTPPNFIGDTMIEASGETHSMSIGQEKESRTHHSLSNVENVQPSNCVVYTDSIGNNQVSASSGFCLHSTARAEKRAEFDVRLREKEKKENSKEQIRLERLVREKQAELNALRGTLH